MAFADIIRATTARMSDVANLIEGIFTASYPLAFGSWTPTLSASGSMTFTGTSIQYAKYIQIGKFVAFIVKAGGTVGGTPSTALGYTVPVTAANTNGGMFPAYCSDAGTPASGMGAFASTTAIQVVKYNNANWAAGSSAFTSFGFYEAA